MKISKQIRFIFILSIITNYSFGQSQKSFNKLISQTNTYLLNYAKLIPNSEKLFSLQESGLPKKEIKYIKTHFDEYDGYSKDSISEFNLLLEFQDLIVHNIERIISHHKFQEDSITDLLTKDSDLFVAVSNDKKLYNLSLAEKTGGSYRSRISIMHYTEINKDSLPTKEEIEKRIKISPYSIFEGDGFNEIYSINTKEGTKYVLTGYVRGCTACFETNIMLVKFKDGFFTQDFDYSVNSRSTEEGGVSYHPKSKTITVDYITDDLTSDCDCINNVNFDGEEYDYSLDIEESELVQKKCHCTFVFNGLNFELIKECWEKLKE